MEQIKVGDVVQLKSGGPFMTVASVGSRSGEPKAYCDWFVEGTKQCTGGFPLTSLKVMREDTSGRGGLSGEAGLSGGPDSWMR
jgi:uncharacterized protein YodC (DUF2158 family)